MGRDDGYSMAEINLLIVDDNEKLRIALRDGLERTGEVKVFHSCASGEDAQAYCLEAPTLPDVILMDVQLSSELNGIQTAVAIRREFTLYPVVFY